MPVLRGGDAHPISIHAPRMGSDPPMLDRRAAGPLDFNPRSPDGERRSTAWTCPPPVRFQSTLPGWGATDAADVADGGFQISIHAPRMGSDRPRLRMCCTFIDFNPRSPDGERQPQHERAPPFLEISIHAPRMGSDTEGKASETDGKVFQSTLPGWGATIHALCMWKRKPKFQSTLPGWGATLMLCSLSSSMLFQSTLPGWGATAGQGKLTTEN